MNDDGVKQIPESFVSTICKRLAQGKRVRRSLHDEGRLHIDRPLPFLCIHRQPVDIDDDGTRQLLEGEASFLTVSASKKTSKSVSELVTELAQEMVNRYGAFLIIEVWSAPDTEVEDAAQTDDIEPTELKPDFVVIPRGINAPHRTTDTLRRNLKRITYLRQPASVHVDIEGKAHPPGLSYLVPTKTAKELSIETIGLQVRPIYRDHSTGEVFPEVLRALQRGVGRALKQAFFTFSKTRTTTKPSHFYSLGRRALVKAVWDVDKRISEVADCFDFLLQVTPVNAEAAWHEFRRRKYKTIPRFYYRPLAVEPAELKRRLFEVRIEDIEDPTLGELFRERQTELDRKITMLSDIGTYRFLLGSLQVYGELDLELYNTAESILQKLPPKSRESSKQLSADDFAIKAQEEIEHYRSQMPDFTAEAMVRDDIYSGLICSQGNLLIGKETKVPENRVNALLQHEIGTHLLTYYNGLAEPFMQLHSGFAGYDALQEGLAVLTEYLVGGLSRPRLRLLAARVVATKCIIDGATFIETHSILCNYYGFNKRTAYTITMRIYRGGGLTKDAVYLRGLLEILDYLKDGGDLETLFVGKMASDHIPFIKELQLRKVLKPPVLLPRYLEMPGVDERLQHARNGIAVHDLIKDRIK